VLLCRIMFLSGMQYHYVGLAGSFRRSLLRPQFKTWAFVRVLGALSCVWTLLLSMPSQAEPELLGNAYLFNCPFYRQDNTFDMSGVQNAVKQLIENKLKVREACRAPLNQLQSSITATDILLASLTADKERVIVSQLFGNFRDDLTARLVYLESQGLGQSSEAEAARATLQQSYQLELQKQITVSVDRATTTENLLRIQLYQYFQQMVTSLRSLHASRCLDVVGRPRDLAAPALEMAALATGFSGIGAKALTFTVLDLASGLSQLLVDRKLRRAQWENDRVSNDQIIACTYYALKYSACEFSAAQSLSRDAQKVQNILRFKPENERHPEFDLVIDFQGRLPIYRNIFARFLSEGTALSLNSNLVDDYYVALVSRPMEIKVPNILPNQPESELPNFDFRTSAGINQANLWLADVRQRGIAFQTNNFAGPVLIEEQVKQAVTDILNKRNVIRTTSEILQNFLAFRDIRDNINTIRNIRGMLNADVTLLKDFIEGRFSDRVLGQDQNALYSAYTLLKNLQEFAELDIKKIDVSKIQSSLKTGVTSGNDPQSPCLTDSDPITQRLACFYIALNQLGLKIYSTMANGAIAQASNQTVLAVPEKAAIRLQLAVTAIEQALLREDLNQQRPELQQYSRYRDQARMRQVVLNNYQSYGVDNAFDESIYQKAFLSMETAFAPEILRMLERASQSDRTLFNEEKNSDAASEHQMDRLGQLCSLFASSLPNIRGGQAWLDYCKVNAPTLEQYRALNPKPVKINYGDACVYPNHQRLLKIQRMTLEQIR
jgi:hypothetical protein